MEKDLNKTFTEKQFKLKVKQVSCIVMTLVFCSSFIIAIWRYGKNPIQASPFIVIMCIFIGFGFFYGKKIDGNTNSAYLGKKIK